MADYPYGNETPLTSGVNAIVDALSGQSASYPYGNETPLTAGVNAILAAIAAGGGGGGTPGYSPTVTITDITGGHRVTITDINGAHSYDCMDGTDGQDGDDGTDGYSPTVTITDITGGHRITITDINGAHSYDCMDGTGGGGDSYFEANESSDPVYEIDINEFVADWTTSPPSATWTNNDGDDMGLTAGTFELSDKTGHTVFGEIELTQGTDSSIDEDYYGGTATIGDETWEIRYYYNHPSLSYITTTYTSIVWSGLVISEIVEVVDLKSGYVPGETIKGNKGDPGDDYVLTNQDKADIAALVAGMFTNGDSSSY